MTTGLSIPEINNLVDQGATIADDGTIQLASVIQTTPKTNKDEDSKEVSADVPSEDIEVPSEKKETSAVFTLLPIIGMFAIFIFISICVVAKKKSKHESVVNENKKNDEGGSEE